MKYKQLKEISAESLIKLNPCVGEFCRYLNLFTFDRINYLDNLKEFERFIAYAQEYHWIGWLIKHKYIKEVEEEKLKVPEVFYHIGQEFKLGKKTYLLSQIDDNEITLIGVEGYAKGNRWAVPQKVTSCEHITQEEFNKITNYESAQFILIKEIDKEIDQDD